MFFQVYKLYKGNNLSVQTNKNNFKLIPNKKWQTSVRMYQCQKRV